MCHEAADSGLRQTFMEGLNRLLNAYGTLLDSGDAQADRQQALVEYSLMLGALTLARASRGDTVSDEILDAASTFLTAKRASN
jgi:TetR/AcrR family transcriptional repressor of nem operon